MVSADAWSSAWCSNGLANALPKAKPTAAGVNPPAHKVPPHASPVFPSSARVHNLWAGAQRTTAGRQEKGAGGRGAAVQLDRRIASMQRHGQPGILRGWTWARKLGRAGSAWIHEYGAPG